tara:strand:+ start:624 stop:842 length:219 start_codon:yes stop_codon:yes gene_type:complete
MNLKFSWYVSLQLQDWIVAQKPYYPNLEECICWVKDKLRREGSIYQLTKKDLEDIEIAYEFQTSEINERSYN